jgi:hypothetical protein
MQRDALSLLLKSESHAATARPDLRACARLSCKTVCLRRFFARPDNLVRTAREHRQQLVAQVMVVFATALQIDAWLKMRWRHAPVVARHVALLDGHTGRVVIDAIAHARFHLAVRVIDLHLPHRLDCGLSGVPGHGE